jgi:hypothetical protein
MRRRFVWLSVPVIGAMAAAVAMPSSGAVSRDRTGPYGPFGFTTQGLGTGPRYGEPSMIWAPDGKHGVICTPGSNKVQKNSTVQYWYTVDGGRTFAHSTSTAGTKGGGDCDVDYLPGGVAISADLEVVDSAIQMTTDWGKTWKPVGTAGQQQDRQWFAHSNDGRTLYLVYHDFVAEAEWFAKGSYDPQKKSVTFPTQDCCHSAQSANQASAPGIAPTPLNGPSLIDEGGNTFSGPILVDPSDPRSQRLYVVYSTSDAQSNANAKDGVPPYGPTRNLLVAYSGDGGATWTTHYAVRARQSADGSTEPAEGAIFPWASIDSHGTIYAVYNSTDGAIGDHFHQYYKFSRDHGAHWSKPVKLDTLGLNRGASVYANSDAAGKGLLDVVWYQSDNGTPSSASKSVLWTPHFAQVTDADTRNPHVVEQALSGIPNHQGGICLQGILCGVAPGSSDRTLADYFQVSINPRTHMAGIAYSDNAGLRPDGVKGEVVFAQQTKFPGQQRSHAVLFAPVAIVPAALKLLGRRRRRRAHRAG